MSDYSQCPAGFDCKIHTGFFEGYSSLNKGDAITENLKIMAANHPSAKIMITGISLGGALAAVASHDILLSLERKSMKRQVMVYTFGQPRIGNKDLA